MILNRGKCLDHSKIILIILSLIISIYSNDIEKKLRRFNLKLPFLKTSSNGKILIDKDVTFFNNKDCIIYGRESGNFVINDGKLEMIEGKEINVVSVFNKNSSEIRLYTISREDDNVDKKLECGELIYKGEVEERNKIFLKPVKVTISNSKNIIYSLEDENSDFIINPKNGILSIENEEFLTIQNVGEKFNLSVIGSDKNGNQTTCTIQIEVHPERKNNANKVPNFEKNEYSFTVAPGNNYIGKIEVMSSDNKFVFKIIEGSTDRIMIDKKTGDLKYIGKPIIENEKMKLVVMATNEQYNEYVNFITVNINFNGLYSEPPKFIDDDKMTLVVVKRYEKYVLLKEFNATDADTTSILLFNIESMKMLNKLRNEITHNIEEEAKKFIIDDNVLSFNGMIREDISSVEILVSVKDSSHIMEPKDYAYVNIIFENDNDVRNDNYLTLLEHPDTIFIGEEIKKGDYIYTIQPKQIPRSLEELIQNNISSNYEFRLVEGNGFVIDNNTGIITVDSIPKENTNLVVEVENMITNDLAETSLAVNINKKKKINTPKKYVFMVREDVKEGTIVGYLETHDYNLTGDVSSNFKITNNNALTVVSTLDYESQNDYLFFYGNNEIKIHVFDVNDNIPKTDRLNISLKLMDNIQPGTILDRLNITDLDKNDNLHFSFTGNNIVTNKLFIDDHQNIITRESFIDVTDKNTTFQIICSDGLHKISITVFLDIIESINCNPIFTENEMRVFHVDENVPGDFIIGSIKGTSGIGCFIKYDIIIDKEEELLPFIIDNYNGSIILKDSLDYEKKDEYKFKVKISSENKESTAYYVVKVNDKNDHTPEFFTHSSIFLIPEDFYVGEVITKVQAFDKDTNDQIYYHLISEGGKFNVNYSTGEIVLVKPLDKEETDEYILNVFATNEEFLMLDVESSFDKMTIKIIVDDVNDNGPIFDLDSYEIVVRKDMNPGEKIIQLHTHDMDNENLIGNVKFDVNEVRYHFQGRSREAPSYIFINNDGEIILNNYIDDFSGGFLTAIVTAKDISSSGTSLKTKCYLKIWICSGEHLTNIVLFNGPMMLNFKKSTQLIKRLVESVENSHILVQSYGYYQRNGIVFDNKTIAKIVVIRDSEEMMVNDDVIIRLKRDTMKLGNGDLFDVEKNEDDFERLELEKREEDIPVLKFIILFFLLSLFLIVLGIVCIMLRDRSNFLLQKQNFIDEEIVAMTKENNNILALSKSAYNDVYYLGRKGSLSTFQTSHLYGDDCYSIQTLKINVGKDDNILQIPYIEEVD
uniref:Cadherin domain-containing protein n=1 Tax=Strongyloides papillosus TaxID=174720 RepID=A0A0N5CHS8_STREA